MITITRYFSNNEVTLGVMKVDGLDFPLYTCEFPWKNNERDISCITIGTYKIKPILSPSKGKCFSVDGVINREHILIHSGNTTNDSRGCILVGLSTGFLSDNFAVLKSRLAMKELLEYIKEPTELVIKNLYV